MPQCNQCGAVFRTLPDETQDHACPKCGWHPSDSAGPFVGWARAKGHSWHVVCEAATESDCWRLLLDHAGDKVALPRGVHPNDRPSPQKAERSLFGDAPDGHGPYAR